AAAARAEPAAVREALDRLGADVKRWGGSFGAVAVDVSTGAVVFARAEHAPLNPASNAKLATAAAALDALGPGHRFSTGLFGKVEREAVDALVLRGDGDPSLRSADLAALAQALRGYGVRRVRGIEVDQTLFDDAYAPPAFEQQPGEWAPFRAPVAPVSVDENTVTFTVRPTREGSDAAVSIEPPGFVEVSGTVATGAKRDPDKLVVALEPRGKRLAARLSGAIPDAGRPIYAVKRVDDPRLLAGYALRAALKQAGIDVQGDVRLGGRHEKHLLVRHASAPLGELLFALGKDSDNFYAEMLFKALAAAGKRPATAADAADAVTAELRTLGALDGGVVIRNGSGLFDANRTTPWAVAQLLRAAYRSPRIAPEFLAQLSIGGVDGTLHGRLRDWAGTRAIRAKTGTLDAVAALSGYVLAPSGKSPVAFSVLVNGVPGKASAARKPMDAVVDALARDVWGGSPPTKTPTP
ncbi:MAG TPA: D-alanyl-D-alanine carboxypeptidase/D-alanyl-D-alanine-endopeptidase, partial [Minicystis sp.]|nr:D-alanyl-D-alanine carboxypeptidase/D-alanyl-D-alanine-endopeptidase [Minicystis sp.]